MRRTAVLVLLALTAGCDAPTRQFVQLTVQNDGYQELTVQVEIKHPEEDVDPEHTLGPRATYQDSFQDVDVLTVRVFRWADGFQLFDGHWGTNSLRRLHDNVLVTIHS